VYEGGCAIRGVVQQQQNGVAGSAILQSRGAEALGDMRALIARGNGHYGRVERVRIGNLHLCATGGAGCGCMQVCWNFREEGCSFFKERTKELLSFWREAGATRIQSCKSSCFFF
jgi:hypothetical protein